jgi:hypothetical protein
MQPYEYGSGYEVQAHSRMWIVDDGDRLDVKIVGPDPQRERV